jgi:DNA-binding NtrC family response regulator
MAKSLAQLKHEFERMIVERTLKQNNDDREKTAVALGITGRTLDKILRRHHISKRRFTKPLPIPTQGEDER